MHLLRDRLRSLTRLLLLRRRLIAALLVGFTVLIGWQTLHPPTPRTVAVLVASRDLASGTRVGAGDVETRAMPPDLVPPGALREAPLGRALAAPVGVGEPLTERRFVGTPLAAGYPGRVITPVRITDPAVAALLRVGDRITLVTGPTTDAADGSGGSHEAGTEPSTSQAVVAAVPPDSESTDPGLPGRVILVAVPPEIAPRVAVSGLSDFVTVTFSG